MPHDIGVYWSCGGRRREPASCAFGASRAQRGQRGDALRAELLLAGTRRTDRDQKPQELRGPFRLNPALRASAARVRAVGAVQRTEDARGQGPEPDERLVARGAVGGGVAMRAMCADCLRVLRESNRELADLSRQTTESLD